MKNYDDFLKYSDSKFPYDVICYVPDDYEPDNKFRPKFITRRRNNRILEYAHLNGEWILLSDLEA